MYFRELETLRGRRSTEPELVEALDEYLHRIGEAARSSLNPRILAEELHAPLSQVIALLELGVESGLLRHRFHLWCPIEEAGLRWVDSLAQASDKFDCDLCDEGPHTYTADEIEVRYVLMVGQHAANH